MGNFEAPSFRLDKSVSYSVLSLVNGWGCDSQEFQLEGPEDQSFDPRPFFNRYIGFFPRQGTEALYVIWFPKNSARAIRSNDFHTVLQFEMKEPNVVSPEEQKAATELFQLCAKKSDPVLVVALGAVEGKKLAYLYTMQDIPFSLGLSHVQTTLFREMFPVANSGIFQ